MISNIVYDMGMVLMNYHPLEACRQYTKNEKDAKKIFEAFFNNPSWIKIDEGTITQEELFDEASKTLNNQYLSDALKKTIDDMPKNILSPIIEMQDVLKWTVASGFKVYLLSNAGTTVSQNRDIIPNISLFDGIIFSADEKVIKPNPEIYTLLTTRFKLKPHECFFVDDNADNIAMAMKLGWQAYHFDGDAKALQQKLKELNS